MSFNIALSGLNATNSELNAISNNIANASTFGFKGARTEFSSVYSGVQASGVEVASVSQNFDKNGTVSSTGRSMDLAINGSGFFVTKDYMGQTLYTRSGVFGTDKNNFVTTNNGAKLQGYRVDGNNKLMSGTVGDIKVSNASLAAQVTSKMDFVANYDASATKVERDFNPEDPKSFNSSYTTQVFDSLGNTHTVTQYFSKTKENEWKVNIQVDGGSTPVSTQTVSFNTDGTLASSVKPFDIKFPAAGAEEMNIEISLEGSTQFGSSFGVSTNNPNGYASGELVGVRIEDNGEVYATYTNGQSLLQGQVVLADFSNPQGLNKVSGTAWTQSFSSGSPVVGAPGTGILGNLSAGSLEGSNVDLTNELVSLMTAQRNYQANAKTISTSDKLTQALFNAV
ncbi:TPA: flagellar basal body protein FlgE [Vibrio parahaemolyticus]|nr:flagellar basal body protein FlgE [Vibrio parahaemolyticus]